MVVDAENLGGFSTAMDDPRLTTIGKTLRKYKIDEIPQLFNVISGKMSLVGPRPQVTYYTDKYDKDEMEILKVKPGITDLASLLFIDMDKTLGNDNVDAIYETKIEPLKNKLRLEYAKNASLGLDIIIMITTLLRILGIKDGKAKSLILFFYPQLKLTY
jgi:lipopolysaccharide/colanic/teichoic acid biosynthesis glycosyltransferase